MENQLRGYSPVERELAGVEGSPHSLVLGNSTVMLWWIMREQGLQARDILISVKTDHCPVELEKDGGGKFEQPTV